MATLSKIQLVGLAGILATMNSRTTNWQRFAQNDPEAEAEFQKMITRESGITMNAPNQEPLEPYAKIMRDEYNTDILPNQDDCNRDTAAMLERVMNMTSEELNAL